MIYACAWLAFFVGVCVGFVAALLVFIILGDD